MRKGWGRSLVSLREAKRGVMAESCKGNVVKRLDILCHVLEQQKSCVQRCTKEGLALPRLVCDPTQRLELKEDQNVAHKLKAERMAQVKSFGVREMKGWKPAATKGSTRAAEAFEASQHRLKLIVSKPMVMEGGA